MRLRTGLAVLPFVLAPLVGCAPQDDDSGSTASDDDTSSAPSDTAATEGSASASPADTCAPDQLNLKNPGQLTVGTDSPAYEPWFVDNDPTNGKGYESAVAYAVAEQLGFTSDQVGWVTVPFNTSYKPGDKNFDFDINQISITPQRAEVVDFSDGYYSAAQAVIALKGSDIAGASSIADLASYKLGAQTGTTSLTAIRETIKTQDEPAVFEDTNAAQRPGRRHRGRPADSVLHHRRRDRGQRDRRPVPAGHR
jgi:polar amino acid transport system substrate-binding protein